MWDEYGNPTDFVDGNLPGPTVFSVGADNRLLADLDFYNLYDDNGSLIQRTRKSDGSYEIYTWNHRGKMTSATAYSPTNQQLWKEERAKPGDTASLRALGIGVCFEIVTSFLFFHVNGGSYSSHFKGRDLCA